MRLFRFSALVAANLRAAVGHAPLEVPRPELVRDLKADGDAGEEYRDAQTGKLLIAHQGDIRHMGQHALPIADARALLHRDLGRIWSMTDSRGLSLVLLTYAAFPIPGRPDTARITVTEAMNEEMREFSKQHAVTLVDLHDRFVALLASGVPRARFFMTEDEWHPNALGYAEIARLVADAFEPHTPR